MKNLRYKIACVFIILIFCLAPLGAIDLDNNTKYTNQDDNGSDISIDDVNVTVDDDDQSKETDTEKAVNDNSTDNETNDLKTEYEPLEVHVNDVYVGDPAVVEVHTDKSIHSVLVAWEDQWTYIEVHDGYATMNIDGLDCGNYFVDVYSDKSSQLKSAGFTVMPIRDPNLSVEVKDILGGENAIAEVHTHDEYTGEVTLTLDGSETKTVKIENGYGKVVFDSLLKPGNHNVVASASACHTFNESEKKTSFSVSKTPFLDVEVSETFANDPINIKVNTAKDLNGICMWEIYNGGYSDYCLGLIENGTYVGTFPRTFPAGNYTMRVQAIDGYYEIAEKEFDFTIKKGKDDPNISINVNDIDPGEYASADIYLDKGYTGNVYVLLDGVEGSIHEDVNGHAHVDFHRELDPGQHKVVVTTEETSDLKSGEKTAEFTVSKVPKLDVEINDTIEGRNPVVKVKTHSKYNGLVMVVADYASIELGHAKDGVYTCELYGKDLTKGNHTAYILALADGPFGQSSADVPFKIIKP